MKKSPKLVITITLALLSLIAIYPPITTRSQTPGELFPDSKGQATPPIQVAPAPPPATAPASATDDRLAFLMVQLSSVEASINAANSALRSAGYRAAVVTDKANTYAKGNELMDRNGGGPVAWREFYGTTAKQFAPRDWEGRAHNYQRPDQFNYVYRANNDQIIKANQEIAALGQRVDALLARRKQLESQQSALWATITFESIANQEYAIQPLYRLQLQIKPSVSGDKSISTARLEALRAAVLVLRTADHTVTATMDSLNADQETAYQTLRDTMQRAHDKFQDVALGFIDSAPPADVQAIKELLALSKKLTAQSKNMCDAYKLALDSDANRDEDGKQTLRGQLQRSLLGFSETTGQMDQALTKLADKWNIQGQAGVKNSDALSVATTATIPRSVEGFPDQNAVIGSQAIWTNSIGMKFVLIKPGTFMMGTPTVEPGHQANETQHQVTISKAFYMAVTPVTQAQWKAVMGKNPSHFKGDDLPVDMVNWNDAVAYCVTLSTKEGKHYHLPTEAQWEYACRAGTQTAYNTGNDESALNTAGWYSGNAGKKSHPVAQKQPNSWGLYDMHGNVWHWCSDWYGEYPVGEQKDPTGPANGSDHVMRGGSWHIDLESCRSGFREKHSSDFRNIHVGFRLELEPSDDLKSNTTTTESNTDATPDTKVVDLLKMVDIAKDTVAGKWEFNNGTLVSDGTAFARLELMYQPPIEYDYRVEFERTAGDSDVVTLCWAAGHQFGVYFGAYNNGVIGIGHISGKGAEVNPSTRKSNGWIKNGQRYTSIVKVRKDGIQVFLDGKLITEWKTDYSDMSMHSKWSLHRDDTIGIGSFQSPTIFYSAEIIEITGKGEPLK